MNIQPQIISNSELDKLFMKNKFVKGKNGLYSKSLSLKDRIILKSKLGQNSNIISDVFEKDFSKENQDAFKGFLALGKTKEFIEKHFVKMFALFGLLNRNSINFNDANQIYSDNKAYGEVFRNIITNPPKNSKILDAFRRYKGVDCGKINSTLRGQCEEYNPRVDNEIKQIKKFIDTQVISEPIELFRGESHKVLEHVRINGEKVNFNDMLDKARLSKNNLDGLNEFLKNNNVELTQKSFMSTSTSKEICKRFGHDAFYWKLTTKPNTKGAYIEPLNLHSCMDDEKEILMQAGSKIKINGAFYDEKSERWCLQGEVSN